MVTLLDHVIDAFLLRATEHDHPNGTTRYIQRYHSNPIQPRSLKVRKSNSIQAALDRCLADEISSEKLLPLALAKAAKRRNLSLPEIEIQLLTTAILNAKGEKIQLDLDLPCALGKTKEEVQAAVQELVDELNELLPDIEDSVVEAISQAVPDALGKVAEIIGENISEQAHEHVLQLMRAHSDRAEGVRRLWGSAIDQLDLLRHFALEWNYAAMEQRKGSYTNQNTAFALMRIVARAYEVVGELIALTRAGYADGALARWRSLHEICVVAMFLAKQSDRCAEMYLSHHWVEELRLLEVDRTSGTASLRNIHHDRYVSNLRMQKTALVKKFGTTFFSDYGWASVELGRSRTTFRDLESHVGLETLRRGYQQANSTVHGGALATLTRVSLGPVGIDGTEAPPAYGCEVAINYAAASLSMMVAELCLDSENADLVATSLVIHNCALKIREQIEKAQKKIPVDSPRTRLLMRKVAQRESRSKPRRNFRR